MNATVVKPAAPKPAATEGGAELASGATGEQRKVVLLSLPNNLVTSKIMPKLYPNSKLRRCTVTVATTLLFVYIARQPSLALSSLKQLFI